MHISALHLVKVGDTSRPYNESTGMGPTGPARPQAQGVPALYYWRLVYVEDVKHFVLECPVIRTYVRDTVMFLVWHQVYAWTCLPYL
jgi:hypothetical protein